MSDVLRQRRTLIEVIIAIFEAELGPARQVPSEVMLAGEGAYGRPAINDVHLARD